MILELQEIALQRDDRLQPGHDLDGQLRYGSNIPVSVVPEMRCGSIASGRMPRSSPASVARAVRAPHRPGERVMHVEPDLRVLEDAMADAVQLVADRPVVGALDRPCHVEVDRLMAVPGVEGDPERRRPLLHRPVSKVAGMVFHGASRTAT